MKKLIALVTATLLTSFAFAGSTEKTISVPKRDQDVKIDFSSGGGKIESVRIQNYPDSDDLEKARKDPKDTKLTFWSFSVDNPSDKKVKMKIAFEIIGKDGESLGHFDKSDTVDAGKSDDNIRVWVHMKTLDIVSAKSAKLSLSIEPK
jgi:hypothetical protein